MSFTISENIQQYSGAINHMLNSILGSKDTAVDKTKKPCSQKGAYVLVEADRQ